MKLKSFKSPLMSLSVTLSSYLLATSAHAQSGDTFAGMANTASQNIYAATNVISTGAYVAGASFGMSGLLSLKKHAESPGQEPISKGVGRIAVGAGLCALPFVMNTAFNSISSGSEGTTVGVQGNTNRL